MDLGLEHLCLDRGAGKETLNVGFAEHVRVGWCGFDLLGFVGLCH